MGRLGRQSGRNNPHGYSSIIPLDRINGDVVSRKQDLPEACNRRTVPFARYPGGQQIAPFLTGTRPHAIVTDNRSVLHQPEIDLLAARAMVTPHARHQIPIGHRADLGLGHHAILPWRLRWRGQIGRTIRDGDK